MHDHTAPEEVWVISHGLMSKPDVTVLDTSGQILAGNVTYVDDDSLTIAFGTPTTGTAYLRR